MCNCIQEIEQKWAGLLMEQVPEARITERIEIQNKAIISPSGEYRMYSEIEGRYEDGKLRKKFHQNLLYRFCPFCGQPITE